MTEVTIKVAGMSCGGCVRNVTGVLKALPGVTDVSVSLDEALAEVSYDPGQINVDRLRQAIIDAGFDSND
jgi:copper chaperone